MPFTDLMRDTLNVLDENGAVLKENVKASVQKNKIITTDTSFPLKPNYHFLRTLGNGMVEDFVVIDPGFRKGMAVIPDTYQASVRRSDIPLADKSTIIQNISGSHNRVYASSTDNSVNIGSIDILATASVVDQIRPYVEKLPVDIQGEMVDHLNTVEKELRSPVGNHSVIRRSLESIKNIAEGASGNLVANGIASLVDKLISY
ncbi:hypothetical protein D3C80_269200 [compost metagenome]